LTRNPNPKGELTMTTSTSSQTNITPVHQKMFNAITSGDYSNFALFSCFVNGEPAAAIVAISQDEHSENMLIEPLFVSITDDMILTDHDGRPAPNPHAPAWAKEIHACDRLEIWPVCDLNWNDEEQGPRPFNAHDDHEAHCETCDADKAHFWSVYGHLKTGGLTCFADFATEAEAVAFAEKLYRAYPHLIR
jgi:hypothetical protein